MASFKCLIFFALVVYTVAAQQETESTDDATRVKKQVYVAAAPAPVLAYSASAPAPVAYPYAYSAYQAGYSYSYPAATPYTAAAYAAYPSYYQDDGKYWPGKYEKTYYPAAYPVAYHY